ncbi:hypothetical protein KCV05_g13669, partial [Aureobasidium melanogenum]
MEQSRDSNLWIPASQHQHADRYEDDDEEEDASVANVVLIEEQYILFDKSCSITYGHSQLNTGHPVRSAIHKQLNGRLVLRWVTTWESLLLYVYDLIFFPQSVYALNSPPQGQNLSGVGLRSRISPHPSFPGSHIPLFNAICGSASSARRVSSYLRVTERGTSSRESTMVGRGGTSGGVDREYI